MAEVFVTFSEPVVGPDGASFVARACGSAGRDGLWQGWVEFTPVEGGPVARSGRETTQPNRVDLEYWATGLTPVYLEGALARARAARAIGGTGAEPASQSDTPRFENAAPAAPSVLNPFSVYRKGESLLRSQLAALSRRHLTNIISHYGLSAQDATQLAALDDASLIELIVGAVRLEVEADTRR